MACIEFMDLSYFVDQGFRKDIKPILHKLKGSFPPGKLIGILGPSGSGKTSLLNVLSGYKKDGIEGHVFVNGRRRDMNIFKRTSCYITQENNLQCLLTVQENMDIAADLKLPSAMKIESKRKVINEILESLAITHCKSTKVCKLSGGEKKRLSIALELLSNPENIFLDEPTTGLDSSSCSKFMTYLKEISLRGKSVICTIHQPSASIFYMFDIIYVLSEGDCIYQGSCQELLPFLEEAGIPCPLFENPADYIIELASDVYGTDKKRELMKRSNDLFGNWSKTDNKEFDVINPSTTRKCEEKGFCDQLAVLLKREFIKSRRNPCLTYLRLITSVTNSLIMSCIFWKVGSDGEKLWFNYNAILAFVIHLMMPSMMLTVLCFPCEVKVLLREHFNRWYRLKAYYLTITLIDLPICIIYCTISNAIIYTLTDQPLELWRFGMFSILGFLICIIAQSIGLLVGVIFEVINGTYVASAISAPMMIFGGFFVTLKDIPPSLQWCTYFSYLRYGVEGMVGAVDGYNRTELPCANEVRCPFKNTTEFMDFMGIEGERFGLDVLVLLGIYLVLRVIIYIVMKNKLTKM